MPQATLSLAPELGSKCCALGCKRPSIWKLTATTPGGEKASYRCCGLHIQQTASAALAWGEANA